MATEMSGATFQVPIRLRGEQVVPVRLSVAYTWELAYDPNTTPEELEKISEEVHRQVFPLFDKASARRGQVKTKDGMVPGAVPADPPPSKEKLHKAMMKRPHMVKAEDKEGGDNKPSKKQRRA